MTRTAKEICKKLEPVMQKDFARFKAFHDRIFSLLKAIPPGGSILISEHCTARSKEMFTDVAELLVIESQLHHKWNEAALEFSEDRTEIVRRPLFKTTVAHIHFYTNKKEYGK